MESKFTVHRDIVKEVTDKLFGGEVTEIMLSNDGEVRATVATATQIHALGATETSLLKALIELDQVRTQEMASAVQRYEEILSHGSMHGMKYLEATLNLAAALAELKEANSLMSSLSQEITDHKRMLELNETEITDANRTIRALTRALADSNARAELLAEQNSNLMKNNEFLNQENIKVRKTLATNAALARGGKALGDALAKARKKDAARRKK